MINYKTEWGYSSYGLSEHQTPQDLPRLTMDYFQPKKRDWFDWCFLDLPSFLGKAIIALIVIAAAIANPAVFFAHALPPFF